MTEMDNTINCNECEFRLYHLSDDNVLDECLYYELLHGSWESAKDTIPEWCPKRGPSRYIDSPFLRCQGVIDG